MAGIEFGLPFRLAACDDFDPMMTDGIARCDSSGRRVRKR